jgi:hypothetical protein
VGVHILHIDVFFESQILHILHIFLHFSFCAYYQKNPQRTETSHILRKKIIFFIVFVNFFAYFAYYLKKNYLWNQCKKISCDPGFNNYPTLARVTGWAEPLKAELAGGRQQGRRPVGLLAPRHW